MRQVDSSLPAAYHNHRIKMKTKYSQILKDMKSAQKFIKANEIIPDEIIVIWTEEEEYRD